MQHDTIEQDTGLRPIDQAARTALAHYWALRILILMDVTGCSAQMAVQAIQDALKERDYDHTTTQPERYRERGAA